LVVSGTGTGDLDSSLIFVSEVGDDVLLKLGGESATSVGTITLEGVGGGEFEIDDLLDLEQRGYTIEFM